MVVINLRLQREGLVAKCQIKGKVTKHAPYPQSFVAHIGFTVSPKLCLNY